jgi:ABC-2 type transport system ATP-binding protein
MIAGPASAAEEPTIRIQGLTRRFDAVTAVDDLDLDVRPGEVFGLLGPNGAGKTTTIKMLITLLPPSGGQATVAGHDIRHEARLVRRSIGYVPQLLSADGSLTARENLMTSARLYHLPPGERKTRIEEAFERTGLVAAADRLVRTFSGGMIRRLEIAQAMLHRPEVLFLDEPTVGLDPIARRAVWGHIADLRRSAGTTILLTTHYMDEAAELCNRVGIMHLGRLIALGTPAELAERAGPGRNLDDAFSYFTGAALDEGEQGGQYRDVARTRRTARRLG